ncbi:hypothetical protein A2U01_0057699, partial [Trifolium medium]|nr:hypothetical protein [Trifolium medium]
MSSLGWGAGGEAWVWRRQLRVWEEEMLGECQSLLPNLSLQAQSSDGWQWQPDPDKGYSVRVWMQSGRIGSTLIPLLQHFRCSLVACPFLDWLFIGGLSYS